MDDNKSTVIRRARILEIIEKEGQVFVEQLSNQFSVSQVTIRNDLGQLEHQNMLIRARGGAIKTNQGQVATDTPLSDKAKENFKQKQAIGKLASEMINDGETIILDSGTTTTEIARNLTKHKGLTIITNALNIATILSENESFNIFMPGGNLRHKSMSLAGVMAEESFKNFFCDKLFLGVDGFDTSYGLSTPNVEEAHLNQLMIKIAKKVIVVTDSSKFSHRRFAFIAPISRINTVITDPGISLDDINKIEKLNIQLLITK